MSKNIAIKVKGSTHVLTEEEAKVLANQIQEKLHDRKQMRQRENFVGKLEYHRKPEDRGPRFELSREVVLGTPKQIADRDRLAKRLNQRSYGC